MTKPNPENLPPVPKARPCAWDWYCQTCGGLQEATAESDGSPYWCDLPCRSGDDAPMRRGFARWGHEWAAVVMLAAARAIFSASHHHAEGWSVGACSDPEGLW